MTNEEAIKMLKTEKACVERQDRKQNCNRYCESCDLCMPIEDVIEGYNMAIKALEQKSRDCKTCIHSYKGNCAGTEECHECMWESKYEQTDGDLISRQAVLKCFNIRELKFKDKEDAELMKHYLELAFDDLAKLPSAEKTAEWIPVSERLPKDRDWYLGVFKESDTGWINPIPFICDYVGRETKATTKEYWILRGHTDSDEQIDDYYSNLECVAWMPLPEPYNEE